MKKKLQKLIREWFVIPKYEKRIIELNSKITELTDDMEYFQSQMYRYKKINKDLRLMIKEKK